MGCAQALAYSHSALELDTISQVRNESLKEEAPK
jgi:hypothetical protein